MRISDLNNSDSYLGNIQRLSSRQAALQTQVSTGQRISLPSDDPTSASRILDLQDEKQRLQQYARNSNRALDIVQSTYGAISDLKKISDRAGELGVLGTGPLEASNYDAYSTELNQLIEQGLATLNTTYSGEQLFGGTRTDQPAFTATRDANGRITAVTYAGSTATPEFNVGDGEKVSPYSTPASNQEYADFLNNLVALRDALSSGNLANVQAAQPGLETSEENLLRSVSEVAARQTRLEGGLAQTEARFFELEQLTSKEADADLPETIVKLTQTQTAYQAALQVGAQVLRVSLLDYLR